MKVGVSAMRLGREKVEELVNRGDLSELMKRIESLEAQLEKKGRLLSDRIEVVENLRHAFMETEFDRDRLQRMSTALLDLCRESGCGGAAVEIVADYGGLDDSHRPTYIG